LVDQVVDIRTREPELACCFGDVPVVALESFTNDSLLMTTCRLVKRERTVIARLAVRKHVMRFEHVRVLAVCADDAGLDGVLELAHVTGPCGFPTCGRCAPRHRQHAEAVAPARRLDEVLDELRDVVTPLGKTWHLE